MNNLSYGRQCIEQDDINAVVKVLRSDWITQGPKIKEFEDTLCRYTGAKYAVVVSHGTAALHLACMALGIKKGDEVISSPISFVASTNAVLYCQGKPVFCDIDRRSVNIDPEKLKKKIIKKTKAVIPVHFAGMPCDMARIGRIAKKNNLGVIEDACHALGAQYKVNGKWKKVGACTYSDMTAFSFHPVKAITAGEGGAVTTNSKALYEKLLLLRNHGITKNRLQFKNGSSGIAGPWYHEMQALGYNYRLTDMQCALGISQMKKLGRFMKRRRQIASFYDKAFAGLPNVQIPENAPGKKHAYHLYTLQIDFKKLKTTRKDFVEKLKKKGILTQVHYIPIYRQPLYRSLKGMKKLALAEEYFKKTISIPIYPGMTPADVSRVVDAVRRVVS